MVIFTQSERKRKPVNSFLYIQLFSMLTVYFCLHLIVYCILTKTFALLCFSKYAGVQENTDGDCVIYVCLVVP